MGAKENCRRWREKNPTYFHDRKDKKREYDRVYREKNKEKIKEDKRRYYQENKGRLYEKARKWKEDNPERHREAAAAWSKSHPEKVNAVTQRYRARKRNAEGSYTADEWLKLCNYYGDICLCCGETKKLTVDHVVPISKGGSNHIENIQPLCGSCNSSKGNWHSTDYREV